MTANWVLARVYRIAGFSESDTCLCTLATPKPQCLLEQGQVDPGNNLM